MTSNMSGEKRPASSSGMQASPAVGAKCVKSSGSSFNTGQSDGGDGDDKREKKKGNPLLVNAILSVE